MLNQSDISGATDCGKVDADVVVEVLVLNGDSGLTHVGRNLITIDNEAIIAVPFIFPEKFAIAVCVDVNSVLYAIRQLNRVDFGEIFFVIEE